MLLGLDPARLALHPLLPLLTRYFQGIHKNLLVHRLPALPRHVHDADQFLVRELWALRALYLAGGLPRPAWRPGSATD